MSDIMAFIVNNAGAGNTTRVLSSVIIYDKRITNLTDPLYFPGKIGLHLNF